MSKLLDRLVHREVDDGPRTVLVTHVQPDPASRDGRSEQEFVRFLAHSREDAERQFAAFVERFTPSSGYRVKVLRDGVL